MHIYKHVELHRNLAMELYFKVSIKMHLFYSIVKLKVLFTFPIHVSSFSPKRKFTSPNLGPIAASQTTQNT